MRGIVTGVIGGALAGVGMTAVMIAERRITRRDPRRGAAGDAVRPAVREDHAAVDKGNSAGHLIASAGFGATYALLRRWVPGLPAAGIGTAYGAGIYAIDMARAVPEHVGKVERSPRAVAGQVALQLLFGAGTALAVAMMTPRENKNA
ncbi:hypothetical protein EV664_103209 [Stakelama pacifica]|uniref:DUF1440 domain-containing protein n=2 Tax=Stakelama pacifica TaxID=517720 RepID=A0A4R6FUG1_9SPHN|nr:hypothetical protein EV664_103209 [Stakelama pacifica]GGO93444.1 hypothetical protein GCM10011329_12880 [Stakelama pacifica]